MLTVEAYKHTGAYNLTNLAIMQSGHAACTDDAGNFHQVVSCCCCCCAHCQLNMTPQGHLIRWSF